MCWRGHGPEHHYMTTVNRGRWRVRQCRRCHLLRVRSYRHPEYPVRRRPLFVLRLATYLSIKRRNRWTDRSVAIRAGISLDTLRDYKRGTGVSEFKGNQRRRPTRQPYRATRVKAAVLAEAMRCDFTQLWMEA